LSRLVLVRHGQASFLEADYDKLSPLGEAQSQLLGEYWVTRRVRFDAVASGPLARQKNTARIVAESFARTSLPFPEPMTVPEFRECDAEGLMRHALPRLLESSSHARELQHAFNCATVPEERARRFQKLVELVFAHWVSGELAVPEVESWMDFSARVNRGVSQFMKQCGRGITAAIFTSGGPIAVAVERALHLAPMNTLRVMWMSRNCSYSEFLFSGERFSMHSFNASPHLDEDSLVTYR